MGPSGWEIFEEHQDRSVNKCFKGPDSKYFEFWRQNQGYYLHKTYVTI